MLWRRPGIAWAPLAGAMVAGAAVAGVIAWRVQLSSIDRQIAEKRAALRKLAISGGVPPNEEVMGYLGVRESSLEQRYQHWLDLVASAPPVEAAAMDPQLYFQERLHDVQRTLERLTAARGMPMPEQLGFPKELPPSDTVPRLLAQLSLLEEAASWVLEQDVAALPSVKIEDPQTVDVEEGVEGVFLLRLPVRVRLRGSLSRVMRAVGAIERARPLIDVRMIRMLVASPPAQAITPEPADGGRPGPSASEDLDVELTLSRYLVVATEPLPSTEEDRLDPKGPPAHTEPPSTRQSKRAKRK